ncbi:hypothetical protein [Streptomyces katrae]|uniref:hypothetical protein n=1 Tax=Streptomyces katrae TaxID=68223 RepID=UPI0004C23740|nr:hypothetical protein [Streptomyces katrae]
MRAKPKTLHFPPSWPTVVIVVVIVLFLVRPDLGTDQIRAVETIVCLLAGGGLAATSGGRQTKPVPEQG